MSVKVLDQVFDRSASKGAQRCVLIAIADAAHHDGVTWAPQGPETNPKSIAYRANCSVSSVERAVKDLVADGELEVRRSRRGRSWVNVYRVVVGTIRNIEIEYDRLPFDLDEPFSSVDELTTNGPRSTRQVAGLNDAAGEGFNPSDSGGSPPHFETFNPANQGGLSSLKDLDPSGTQEHDPSADAAGVCAAVDVDALKLTGGMRKLGVGKAARVEALADPERAWAWFEVARREGTRNPAGLFVDGFRSGEWPPGRGPHASAAARRHAAKERSLEALVDAGAPDEARHMIDVEWDTLTTVERAELHAFVDELLSARLPDLRDEVPVAEGADVA